jgi:hypothetical protein
MTLRLFGILDRVEYVTTDNHYYVTLRIDYQGEQFPQIMKVLNKLLANENKKLIEISTYPSDKWEAAFRFWHKVISLIVKDLAAKRITVICDTIPLTYLNFKEYLKAEYGRHKILYEKDGKVTIQNESSTKYSFDELMDIINNTLEYARDNSIDIDTYLEEYKELHNAT